MNEKSEHFLEKCIRNNWNFGLKLHPSVHCREFFRIRLQDFVEYMFVDWVMCGVSYQVVHKKDGVMLLPESIPPFQLLRRHPTLFKWMYEYTPLRQAELRDHVYMEMICSDVMGGLIDEVVAQIDEKAVIPFTEDVDCKYQLAQMGIALIHQLGKLDTSLVFERQKAEARRGWAQGPYLPGHQMVLSYMAQEAIVNTFIVRTFPNGLTLSDIESGKWEHIIQSEEIHFLQSLLQAEIPSLRNWPELQETAMRVVRAVAVTRQDEIDSSFFLWQKFADIDEVETQTINLFSRRVQGVEMFAAELESGCQSASVFLFGEQDHPMRVELFGRPRSDRVTYHFGESDPNSVKSWFYGTALDLAWDSSTAVLIIEHASDLTAGFVSLKSNQVWGYELQCDSTSLAYHRLPPEIVKNLYAQVWDEPALVEPNFK